MHGIQKKALISGRSREVITSGKAGGLKNREPVKADNKRALLGGSVPSIARPGGKGVSRRNHKAPLIPWNGRAQPQNQGFGLSPYRGYPASRPRARLLLRKSSGAPGRRAHPADAFCGKHPCPRATTQASRKGQTLCVPGKGGGF
jgi:hypothetical protein